MNDSHSASPRASRLVANEADSAVFLAALAGRVREARGRRGISRKALAQAAGVSERHLAQVEGGETNASVVGLRNIAHALGVTLVELLEPPRDENGERIIRRLLDRLPAARQQEVILRLTRELAAEEAQRRQRVALVGLRGGGKSTLGRCLAEESGVRFVELNNEIERDAGMKSSEIFLLYGEAGFRRIERRCLEMLLADSEPMVISVGGGVVSDPETFNLLLGGCTTVWIKASPGEHMARVVAQGDLRPIAGHAEAMDDMRRILAAREPLYRRADHIVDTSGQTVQQSLEQLRQALAA